MSYLLRRVILEDRWQKQLDEIIAFCCDTKIEEILLMEQSHQILMVPYTLEKHKRMADIYCKMAEELRKNDIVFSINIASIVGHLDADVEENMILPYQKFVGSDFKEAKACYCILDKRWQKYAVDVCSLYAQSNPDKLFIDDDFRSLGHSTRIGCFCPIHVKKTSLKSGVELTAERLVEHLCGTSKQDQEIKKAWMMINFEGQMQAAREIRKATHKISHDTRLGLMNSGERAHSVQGRDMDKLLREFSGKKQRPLSRPLGGGYSDVIHDDLIDVHQGMALSISQIGPDVQIVSEVENWPHTRFTKSIHSTQVQMELHALAGAHDFSLNIYDYLASPFLQEPDFGDMLKENKGKLIKIQEFRRDKILTGFGLPWKKDTALKTSIRGDLNNIFPSRTIDSLLPQFGIPTQFKIAKGNVILGDAINCYSDSEIISLLSGGLMIDGSALEHLCKRGYQKFLGAETAGHVRFAALERLDRNEFSGMFGENILPTNWFRMEKEKRYNYEIILHKDARSISTLLDLEMNELSPGTVLFENELGGRVAIMAVPIDKWQWAYRSRAYQIGKVVNWLLYDKLPLWIEDCPNVAPFYYENVETGEGLLGIASGNLDPIDIKIHSKLEIKDFFTNNMKDYRIEPLSVRFFRTRKTYDPNMNESNLGGNSE